jgi:hypothetical protein
VRFVLARVINPAIEPVSLAEARVHLRAMSDSSEDVTITGLIVAAREWVEDYTGRALVEQKWALSLDRRIGAAGQYPIPFPNPSNGYGWYQGEWSESVSGWLLRKSPVISVTEFVSIADDGTETAITAADYRLVDSDSKWPRIVPVNSWAGDAFRITYRAGYAAGVGSPDPTPDVADVPQRYKQAILLHAEAHYDRDRDMMQRLLDAAENLIKPERCELSLA